MEVIEQTVDVVRVVSMVGDLDARTAPIAHRRLRELLPGGAPMLLDLTAVPYISSAGLRILLMVYRQAQRTDTPIALTGLSPELRGVLSATGFLRFFRVTDSIGSGITSLRRETVSRPAH